MYWLTEICEVSRSDYHLKDAQEHGFRNTKDRLLIYRTLKFKRLLFLPRLKYYKIGLG